MVFRNHHSPTAMFSFGPSRYRTDNWEVDTAHYPDTDGLEEFLSQNPNYEVVVEGDSTAQSTGGLDNGDLSRAGDGLEKLSVDELREIATNEGVDAPSTLARLTKAETLIEKIRAAREAALG